jgi:aerobic carbon-monoxide dehydrogenase medium subunit
VKPVDFCLHQPETVADAVKLLSEHGDDAKVLAGGQSLVPLLNFRLARPGHLVDIGRIASLAQIQHTAGALVIGAAVRQAQAEHSGAVAGLAPLLAAALPNIAHPPVRSRGTIGGSLAHADPAAELPAVALALDASLTAVSVRGSRDIAAAGFFRGSLETALDSDELLTEIRIPAPGPHTGAAFCEVARRQGDFALVGVAAQLAMADGLVAGARICISGVDRVPRRCPAAEALLAGTRPVPAVLAEAADAVRASVQPCSDLHATAAYRTDVAGTLTARALAAAARRAAAGRWPKPGNMGSRSGVT